MDPESFLYIGLICFISGAAASLSPLQKSKNHIYILSSLGAICFMIAGTALSLGIHYGASYFFKMSSVFELKFQGDALSGFFLTVISLLTFAVSVYSIGYTKAMHNAGLMGFLFNLFILSMCGVVLSGNIITFLVMWETMSIVSYFLVTFDREEKSEKAGLIYAVMTHIGTAFIIVLFMILYQYTGQMDFGTIRASSGSIPAGLKAIVFLCAVAGFGTKAGIVPLHTWLPKAHPAAPSNVSALMSGVMIKTGIYGFIRICLDVAGPGPEWWGITILVIGAVSSILGVLYALMEHDLKRLLAYHSVENIGIILLGIGASMMFRGHNLPGLSALALVAGLYHTLNHAVFKGLLFLGSGSVMHACHTKNMEEMGGLIRSMPYTGLFFLIGSISICAFPPFNGFVSEWLTYQSLLLGFEAPSLVSKIVSPLGGAALALTGALAAACFVKAFGITFLGLPRSADARDAKEATPSMLLGMGLLSVLCLVFGIFPKTVLALTAAPVFNLTGSAGVVSERSILFVNETAAAVSPAALILAIFFIFVAIYIFIFMMGGKTRIRYADSWDCGLPQLTHRMQYTATAFTKPLRMIFKKIYLPIKEIKVSYVVKPFFVSSIQYRGEITPFFEKYIYSPSTGIVYRTAKKIRTLQSGSLHLYLGYILLTLILLLIFGS